MTPIRSLDALPRVRLRELPIALEPGDARLLLVGLDDPLWQRAPSPLDPAERARAARFHFERDARRYRASHTALRRVLAHHVGRPADALRFSASAFGKPALEGEHGWHFNLSHSGGLGLIGLCRGAPIGVDAEWMRPLDDRPALVRAHFSDAECAQFEHLPAELQQDAFFAAWSQKEAVMKADGRGLSMDPRTLEVTIDPRAPTHLMCERPIFDDPWSLWSTRWPDGAWLAAAVARPSVRFIAHLLVEP